LCLQSLQHRLLLLTNWPLVIAGVFETSAGMLGMMAATVPGTPGLALYCDLLGSCAASAAADPAAWPCFRAALSPMLQQAQVCVKVLTRQASSVELASSLPGCGLVIRCPGDDTTTSVLQSSDQITPAGSEPASAGYCFGSAVILQYTLLQTAGSAVHKAEGAAQQVNIVQGCAGAASAASATSGLPAAACEAALQQIAAACHIWRQQLSAAGATPEQQHQQQQQQVVQNSARPLQASQLPRQHFNVQLQDVAAVHEQLLQRLLGEGSSVYVDSFQRVMGNPIGNPAQLTKMMRASMQAVEFAAAGASSHTKGGAAAEAADEVLELAQAVALPDAIQTTIEAMLLQHCFLQQAQQQLQPQQQQAHPKVGVAAHIGMLGRLQLLLSDQVYLQRWLAAGRDLSSFQTSGGGLQLLQLSMLQVQLSGSAAAVTEDAADTRTSLGSPADTSMYNLCTGLTLQGEVHQPCCGCIMMLSSSSRP
jgi:hypothetical protein